MTMPITAAELAEMESRCEAERTGRVSYSDEVARLLAEVRRLAAIVERLPKTADGVPVTLGDKLWNSIYDQAGTVGLWGGMLVCRFYYNFTGSPVNRWNDLDLAKCYSTREAAAAASARDEKGEGKAS